MPTMIGAYGDWASRVAPDPPRLSFRRPEFRDFRAWKARARTRLNDLLLPPAEAEAPKVTVSHHQEFDGLAIEHLSWQLPYGPPTEAIFLKPANARGKLPGIVGLHDHGGNKYFGLRKITRSSKDPHPLMIKHQERYYSGMAWANELARRGYAVLVHDAFAFASRRVRPQDVPQVLKGDFAEQDPEAIDEIERYNRFAANHEHIMAKSLFSAGLTWPGVFAYEDQRAVDYLAGRPDVDATRLGCAGLSGGGLRTVMLAGLDARIRVACCAGMMTTWHDYLLNKCHTHTWMCYIPGAPLEFDYPEILGLNVPNAVMVLNNSQDQLFTPPEMERADRILADVYRKAGVPDRYKCGFYPGPHKFDADMQRDAFAWFDKWLKA